MVKPFAIEGLAFDKASVRSTDSFGRMHVETSNISKAAINEYLGREIPDFEELGLDPNKIYKLLRDPEELQKAAPTFNRLPILSRHVAVTADAHQPDLIVGATGTDAEFTTPHLRNSLVIWAKGGIDAVESGAQKELSSAYRYRADMTPGNFDGQKYDGVMRDIVGNHVALVKEGRAGADVVVGDSNQEIAMSKKLTKTLLLSGIACTTLGALTAHLGPRLAQDAKLDLRPIVADLTVKNFKAKRPVIMAALATALEGKLAKDATIEDVAEVLDAMQTPEVTEAVAAVAADPAAGEDPDASANKPPPDATDASPIERIKDFLRAQGVADDVLAQLDAMMVDGAEDADKDKDKDDDDEDERKRKAAMAKDEPPNFKGKPEVGKGPPPTKQAMDAAIAGAVKTATALAIKTQREIRDAEKAVRPYVGELSMAFDTAEDVYRAALKTMGVKTDDLHASALRPVLEAQPIPGATPRRPKLAQDEAGAVSGFAKRFPNADKVAVHS